MSENTESQPVASGNGQDAAQHVALQRIYIKDCSFESPRAPAVFSAPLNPE
ncbi:MAG: protein-export chaperone SecB, partial [Gammaproteobacteria bacterium]